MQIFLHHLDGTQSVAEINEHTSLETLLANFNAEGCRVVYQGSHISSLECVDNLGNLYLTADLDGGKKKKKKKVFTNKKKNKHIHKRVKLAVYTLYSVDGIFWLIQERET